MKGIIINEFNDEALNQIVEVIRPIIYLKDKEIERLNKCYCERTDCSGRIKNSKKYESMQEENERLNNIINELEETIKNKIKGFKEDKDYFIDEKDMYELDNLIQELKGSNNNEQ